MLLAVGKDFPQLRDNFGGAGLSLDVNILAILPMDDGFKVEYWQQRGRVSKSAITGMTLGYRWNRNHQMYFQ